MKIWQGGEAKGERFLDRVERRRSAVLPIALEDKVRKIVRAVAERGDRALVPLVKRFDLKGLTATGVPLLGQLGGDETVDEGFVEAVDLATANLEAFHAPQAQHGYATDIDGVDITVRVRPLDSVGVYVPGGSAVYLSSLLMAVVPARLAGVERIAVATPPRAFLSSPYLRFVLGRLGIGEVYLMGGAHAVAALAYGTESVTQVDKIVGPGGRWVTAAKRAVAGVVGIDSLAGPSELVVVADGHADADLVAADLLAQMEHDPDALALLVTTSRPLAIKVEKLVANRVRRLPKNAVAREANRRWAAAWVVSSFPEALAVVNRVAPGHVSLQVQDPRRLVDGLDQAATVFLGPWTAAALGDYVLGVNHVSPTAATVRFSSSLGVWDFVRRTTVVEVAPHRYGRLAAAAERLAEHESLSEHAASLRTGRRGKA